MLINLQHWSENYLQFHCTDCVLDKMTSPIIFILLTGPEMFPYKTVHGMPAYRKHITAATFYCLFETCSIERPPSSSNGVYLWLARFTWYLSAGCDVVIAVTEVTVDR